MKARIHLVVDRPNGRCSIAEIGGVRVTPIMLEAAEDLLHALTTGTRPLPQGLYELCATAFGTTPEDAQQRLLVALRGEGIPGQQ